MVKFETKQEAALSKWDHECVFPRDRSALGLPQIKAVVGHTWELFQLKRPPAVVQVTPDDKGYTHGALAWVAHDCLTMGVQQPTLATSMVLHEVAHAVLEDPLARLEMRKPVEREIHGPLWLANYLFLLDRLMGPLYNQFHVRSTLPPEVRGWTIPYHPTVRGQPRGDLV